MCQLRCGLYRAGGPPQCASLEGTQCPSSRSVTSFPTDRNLCTREMRRGVLISAGPCSERPFKDRTLDQTIGRMSEDARRMVGRNVRRLRTVDAFQERLATAAETWMRASEQSGPRSCVHNLRGPNPRQWRWRLQRPGLPHNGQGRVTRLGASRGRFNRRSALSRFQEGTAVPTENQIQSY